MLVCACMQAGWGALGLGTRSQFRTVESPYVAGGPFQDVVQGGLGGSTEPRSGK